MNHLVKDCPKKPVRSDPGRQGQPRCYTCHKVGHVAMHCLANMLAVTEETSDQSMLCSRIVKGQQVDDILLDTGFFRTLVHQNVSNVPRMPKSQWEETNIGFNDPATCYKRAIPANCYGYCGSIPKGSVR